MAANQRVDLAFLGELVQVLGELLQRRRFLTALRTAALLAFGLVLGLGGLWRLALFDAVGNEIDHVQARHALLVQVVHGVRVFFAKDCHEHVGTVDLFLAVAGGLHMHDGALDHPLETQCGLGVHFVRSGNLRRVVFDEVRQR